MQQQIFQSLSQEINPECGWIVEGEENSRSCLKLIEELINNRINQSIQADYTRKRAIGSEVSENLENSTKKQKIYGTSSSTSDEESSEEDSAIQSILNSEGDTGTDFDDKDRAEAWEKIQESIKANPQEFCESLFDNKGYQLYTDSPEFNAIRGREEEFVKLLVDSHFNLESELHTNMQERERPKTLLMASAVIKYDIERDFKKALLTALLKVGVNPNRQSSFEGLSALHVALTYGRDNECIKLLLSHGADKYLENDNGLTPFEYVLSFCAKTAMTLKESKNDWDWLLDEFLCTINPKKEIATNMTPLMVAVLCAPELVSPLLIRRKAQVNHRNSLGRTVAHVLAKAIPFISDDDQLDVNTLINRVNVNMQDSEGKTALHLAALKDNPIPVFMSILLNHQADPNIQDFSGRTALDYLLNRLNTQVSVIDDDTLERMIEVIRELLQHGALPPTSWSLLEVSIAASELPVLESALEETDFPQANLNQALLYAVIFREVRALDILLAAGADKEHRINGFSLLQLATQLGYHDCVQVLCKAGANLEYRNSQQNGNTALCMAAVRNRGISAGHLLDYGAHIEAKNAHNCGPLFLAEDSVGFNSGRKTCFELLIERGADVNSLNGASKETPLMRLCRAGDRGAISLLLRHRAFINKTDSLGNTPLSLAIARSDDIPDILLRNCFWSYMPSERNLKISSRRIFEVVRAMQCRKFPSKLIAKVLLSNNSLDGIKDDLINMFMHLLTNQSLKQALEIKAFVPLIQVFKELNNQERSGIVGFLVEKARPYFLLSRRRFSKNDQKAITRLAKVATSLPDTIKKGLNERLKEIDGAQELIS